MRCSAIAARASGSVSSIPGNTWRVTPATISSALSASHSAARIRRNDALTAPAPSNPKRITPCTGITKSYGRKACSCSRSICSNTTATRRRNSKHALPACVLTAGDLHRWKSMKRLLKLGKLALRSAAGVFPMARRSIFPPTTTSPSRSTSPKARRTCSSCLRCRCAGRAQPSRADPSVRTTSRGIGRRIRRPRQQRPDAVTTLLQVGKLRLKLALEPDVAHAHAHVGVARVIERLQRFACRAGRRVLRAVPGLHGRGQARALLDRADGLLQQRGEALAAGLSQPEAAGIGGDLRLPAAADRQSCAAFGRASSDR